MQEAQQTRSSATVSQTGGYADTTVETNDRLFGYCMNARGWTLQPALARGNDTPISVETVTTTGKPRWECLPTEVADYTRCHVTASTPKREGGGPVR
jgi:hypothetical protein